MTYTLSVEEDELRLISAGLNELPRKFSQALFAKLQEQVFAQEAQSARAEEQASEKVEKDSKPSA